MPAWPNWLLAICIVIFIAVSVILVLTVLIQKPQGGGLGSAFGGGSSGQTAFGTKTGDALTVLTIGVFVLFMALAIALNYGTRIVGVTAGAGDNSAQTAPADEPAPDGTSSTTPAAPESSGTPASTPTSTPVGTPAGAPTGTTEPAPAATPAAEPAPAPAPAPGR